MTAPARPLAKAASAHRSSPVMRARPAANSATQRYLRALVSPKGIFGLAILAVLVGLALLAPLIYPGGFDQQGRNSFAAATLAQPFGNDEFGRDLFMRSIYALRVTLALVAIAVPAGAVLGTLAGLSGMVWHPLGEAMQRLFDIILGFPGIILGICIAMIVGPGPMALGLTIVLFIMPGFGRLARGLLLSEQSREYVIAAQILGVGKLRIMTRHIIPNILDPLVVQVALAMTGGVFIEAGLSLVGLGIQPPTPSLGTLLSSGVRYVSIQPMYTAGPVIILLLLTLAFNLIADALNTAASRAARRS